MIIVGDNYYCIVTCVLVREIISAVILLFMYLLHVSVIFEWVIDVLMSTNIQFVLSNVSISNNVIRIYLIYRMNNTNWYYITILQYIE